MELKNTRSRGKTLRMAPLVVEHVRARVPLEIS